MPFYTGKSADGSDMQEHRGVYVNPDNGSEWSSQPYPKQQRSVNLREEYNTYTNGRFSLQMVYQQIIDKTCPLSKRVRDFVLSHYDENGNFKIDEDED